MLKNGWLCYTRMYRSHRIPVWYIYLHWSHRNSTIHEAKLTTSPMDPMGLTSTGKRKEQPQQQQQQQQHSFGKSHTKHHLFKKTLSSHVTSKFLDAKEQFHPCWHQYLGTVVFFSFRNDDDEIISSWWLNQPIWKICDSQIGSWNPKDPDENKKSLKPPTRYPCRFFCSPPENREITWLRNIRSYATPRTIVLTLLTLTRPRSSTWILLDWRFAWNRCFYIPISLKYMLKVEFHHFYPTSLSFPMRKKNPKWLFDSSELHPK